MCFTWELGRVRPRAMGKNQLKGSTRADQKVDFGCL
jgi:hypothetical protein